MQYYNERSSNINTRVYKISHILNFVKIYWKKSGWTFCGKIKVDNGKVRKIKWK